MPTNPLVRMKTSFTSKESEPHGMTAQISEDLLFPKSVAVRAHGQIVVRVDLRFQCAVGFRRGDGRIRPLYFTATNFLATIACASFVSMKSKNARTSPEGTSFVTKIRGRLSG